MPVDHTEKGFEQAIEHCLLTGGYRKGDPATFDAALAVDRPTLIEFLKDSQPEEWSKLASIYGKDVETKVVENIAANLDQRGMLECLRHGVSDRWNHTASLPALITNCHRDPKKARAEVLYGHIFCLPPGHTHYDVTGRVAADWLGRGSLARTDIRFRSVLLRRLRRAGRVLRPAAGFPVFHGMVNAQTLKSSVSILRAL